LACKSVGVGEQEKKEKVREKEKVWTGGGGRGCIERAIPKRVAPKRGGKEGKKRKERGN